MNERVIVVLGISGVGKTTMVKSFIDDYPFVLSIRASELLKRQLSENNSEKLRKAAPTKIHSNQNKLASAFQKFKRASPKRHIIFDGHSIIDNDQGIVVIPTETFETIAPDLIIFIEDSPSLISARRANDTSRSRPHLSVEELDAQQILAKEIAIKYGRELLVQCRTITSGDHDSFNHQLIDILGING